MEVKVKVFRFDPEIDKKPHYETYKIEAEPTDRVLDMLEYIKGTFDGTLSFRRSCAHGICGSDGMRINGRNYLACKALLKDLHSRKITVEPIDGTAGDQGPDRGHGALLRQLPAGDCLILSTMKPRRRKSACKVLSNESALTIPPSAFCAPAAPLPAPPFGLMTSTSDRQQLLLRTASSSTAATRPLQSACASSMTNLASIAATPSSTAPIACPREIEITQAIGEVKRAIVTGSLE